MSTRPRHPPVLQKPDTGWRRRWYIVIFEADTPAGKRFDVMIMAAILLSVLTVMLDSVEAVRARYGDWLLLLEWVFTIGFTIEYAVRLVVVDHAWRYGRSFFGVVDLLSILPTWLAFFLPESRFLADVRVLRLLRFFRIMKLGHHLREASMLVEALVASRRKITVFLAFILGLVTILGTLIYVIEDSSAGFTSIPKSIYWAIVTLTTVGYGDIAPRTPLGQALASLVMITGYAIIAVPTGIFSVEIARVMNRSSNVTSRACPGCLASGLDDDALYCKRCGDRLPPRCSG